MSKERCAGMHTVQKVINSTFVALIFIKYLKFPTFPLNAVFENGKNQNTSNHTYNSG